MSTDISDLHQTARRSAIERAEKEYKVQCDVFDTADRKAQATTTIAGALLAADLGFVSKLSETPSLVAQVILVVITLALGCSVLMALCAMYARDSELPASGAETESKYKSLIAQTTSDNFSKAEIELLDFLLEKLQQANASVGVVSSKKADWVHRAQKALIAAAFATIVLTLALTFYPNLLALKSGSEPAVALAPAEASNVDQLKRPRLDPSSSASIAYSAETPAEVKSASSSLATAPH
ncbi:hypothetical protein AYM40_15575 [Paraburkholderia phytofirmans OLGA172]|uniref:Pycsar effector protein domain-containing protein n=1 Tax=Paraburkholderia phytofirmans OLGA172 TaxID=1417228 RepID=A0A160FN06_9BURK|nr:hypothetical protein [Paraburkholderia phytofirmans]ANB73618.1 hypothetical protein AYM40_15575 [Paraburkholderia phytofirmans OLGA172]